MSVFSTNQNRQMYIVNGSSVTNNVSSVGDLKIESGNGKFYGIYKGPKGNIRTDIVDINKVMSVTATAPNALKLKKKSVTVYLADGASTIQAGQDYILTIDIKQAFGIGDNSTYQKFGAVRGKSGMSASQLWEDMKVSLEKNFSRENTNWFTFATLSASDVSAWSTGAYAKGAIVKNSNTMYVVESALTSSDDNFSTLVTNGKVREIGGALIITEADQPYVRGKVAKQNVYFDLSFSTVTVSGAEVVFGATSTSYTLESKNGHVIADQEYFYMGERGDQYREAGFPYNLDVDYLANSNTDYYTVNIHYYWDSEDGQKSEKDMYFAFSAADGVTALLTKLGTGDGNLNVAGTPSTGDLGL